ncbi:MAG: hypothetical protein O2994_11510 [Proteobacteria bacterium]|nr:hypothetical protein [Pseudomonadota bacterium]MDA1153167.1 hypothetical protein [Pseudomonadota bacterium]
MVDRNPTRRRAVDWALTGGVTLLIIRCGVQGLFIWAGLALWRRTGPAAPRLAG